MMRHTQTVPNLAAEVAIKRTLPAENWGHYFLIPDRAVYELHPAVYVDIRHNCHWPEMLSKECKWYDVKQSLSFEIVVCLSDFSLALHSYLLPQKKGEFKVTVEDSREGWRDALKATLEAYFLGHRQPAFDISLLRRDTFGAFFRYSPYVTGLSLLL